MEKLHVTVGFVFTQVMFCDGHGKMHFHRVMTDVDKPWKSVKEILGLVKNALGVDKPNFPNELLKSLHIELQFKTIHFTSLLASLREELVSYLDRACQLTIQVFDQMEESINSQEPMEEEQVGESEELVVREIGQAMPSEESRLFPIYREADAVLVIFEGVDRVNMEVWDKRSQSLHFFVDEECADTVTDFDQRGSPGYLN